MSQRFATGLLKYAEKKQVKNPLEVFEAAMANIMPVLEVKARRVGGANLSGSYRS